MRNKALFRVLSSGLIDLDGVAALLHMKSDTLTRMIKEKVELDPVYQDYLELYYKAALTGNSKRRMVRAGAHARGENKGEHLCLSKDEFYRTAEAIFSAAEAGHSTCHVVAFFDIDNLKHINDTRGHLYGDLYIQTILKRIGDSCRTEDILCRFGGDEFLLVMSVPPEANIASLCEKIKSRCEQAFAEDPAFSVSVGFASGEISSEYWDSDLKALIDGADKAMYVSKKAKQQNHNKNNEEVRV